MHAAQLKPPPETAASFNLEDDAERFMHGVLRRFHTEIPGLHTLHAIRRVAPEVGGGRCRCVLTVTSYQPQRRGARCQWHLITWNIDAVSIHFCRYADAAAALAALLA